MKILIFFSSSAEINLPPFHLDRAPPFQAALPSRKNFSKERERERKRVARLEEEKKKKKKGCERKKISGRNTEKRMPPLPPLHPPPPRPPRSRTESEWIALLLRGGEERLQDLRENRSSSFKTLLRSWLERRREIRYPPL